MYKLAGELGYTPADFLSSRGYPANVNIVTGSAECKAEFVFVTALELSGFEARLRAVQPGRWISDPGIRSRKQICADLPLNVNGVSGRQDAWKTFPRIPQCSWFLTRETPAVESPKTPCYRFA